jgi:RNA polymerase-binding transcription factor DksA
VKKSASKLSPKARQSPAKTARPFKKSETKKTVLGKSSGKKSAGKISPAKKSPAKKSGGKKPALVKPVIKAPVKKSPVQKASAKAPVKVAFAKPKPIIKAPEKKVPEKKTPETKAPEKKIAAQPVIAARASAKTKHSAPVKPAAVPVQMKPEPFKAGPSVATNLKPRKSQIGLTVKELERFWDLLRAKRRELVGDMSSMEREALRSGSASNLSTLPMHMADMGTDNFEQEFTLGLVEKDRSLLREINNALSKIQNGTYGICEGTGLPISKARLEAAPWSRFSIEYARQKEKNGMGVRTL